MRPCRATALIAFVVAFPMACGDSATTGSGGGTALRSPFFEDRVLNIAHRGGNRLAPEATIEAFHAARKVGVDALEMDVQRTSDGVIIVMHDSSVDRTTNGSGEVSDMTLAELKQLDAGYNHTRDRGETYPFRGQGVTVPTLAEVLETFPDDFMVIEIKGSDPSVSADYAAVLREHDAFDRVVTASFDEAVIDAYRAAAPGAQTSLALPEVLTLFALSPEAEADYVPPGEFLQVPPVFQGVEVMTPDFVARANRFGLRMHVWGTGNDRDVMQSMIDLGAHGLIVDDVELARDVIRENE